MNQYVGIVMTFPVQKHAVPPKTLFN